MRARLLIGLFVVSSVATLGLRASGVFDRHRAAKAAAERMGINISMDDDEDSNNGGAGAGHASHELPVTLARSSAASDVFEWSGTPAAGQAIEIRSLMGSIRAEPSTGAQVEVIATREGSSRDAVQIKAIDRGDRITICAAHPQSEDEDQTVGCGTAVLSLNGRKQTHSDARVDFVVKLPAGTKLIARAVDGLVTARALSGDVQASTVNGDIDVETSGAAEAKTINGNIGARIGRLASSHNSFETLHGNVRLTLPATTSAELTAESVTGRVESDLPIQAREARRTKLEGSLGAAGGPGLTVKTVAGDVSILKATPIP